MYLFDNMLLLFDLAAVGFGIFLLVNPNKAFRFGSKDSANREIPKNWHIIGRILGVVFIIGGVLFLLMRFR